MIRRFCRLANLSLFGHISMKMFLYDIIWRHGLFGVELPGASHGIPGTPGRLAIDVRGSHAIRRYGTGMCSFRYVRIVRDIFSSPKG
jgi:hypothetical protein